MARRPRASRLETRTARLKLPVRLTVISPGIALGYRRCAGAGRFVVRVADGKGGNWTKVVGIADDHENADGEHVLTWWQAQDKARKLARGTDDHAGRPVTVKEAIDTYEKDLIARRGSLRNVGRIRKHLTPRLASRPVALLTSDELAAWRDSLLAAAMKPATAVRLCKAMKAALNLTARRNRKRILNRDEWREGLGGIAEDFESRNVQRLSDDQVRNVVAAAYEIDRAFGLYVETAAVTGARPSQIARLIVADLQDGTAPRLMMPPSRKGDRRRKPPGKTPVPITSGLAERLASNRPPDEPLLLRADGRAWQSDKRADDHTQLYARAAKRAGVTGTLYQLRHSSIVRGLLAGIPLRVVCAMHDTSAAMVEKTYAAFIADHSDAVVRPALLSTAAPAAKVVPITGRRP
jgi:hypothetical protein